MSLTTFRRTLKHCALFLVASLLLVHSGPLPAQQPSPAQPPENAPPTAPSTEPPHDELFALFSRTLDNVVLEGHFTVDGSEAPPRKERYEIKQVTKSDRGDYWIFQTRITYGEHDLTLPLPLQVKWAGRTPVITLDDVAIPGLGTFDARVVIDENRYAGTWQHGEVGGHLFGTIRKLDAATSDSAPQ